LHEFRFGIQQESFLCQVQVCFSAKLHLSHFKITMEAV
jgi:hypothetical protein